jgi:hypothetical protein
LIVEESGRIYFGGRTLFEVHLIRGANRERTLIQYTEVMRGRYLCSDAKTTRYNLKREATSK